MDKETGKINRIGIMGGTFNPIHYGHLVAAEGARHDLGLEKVIFVPAGQLPNKPGFQVVGPRHRFFMTSLAVDSNPFFQVSSIEIERPGPSYTIDTLQEISRLYPQAEIYFITGADALLDIHTWKGVETLLTISRFVAATRPGYQLSELWKKLNGIFGDLKDRIICMEVPALAISSTDIRSRVREGRPIKYLLPEPVEDYISKNNLYKQ